MSKQRHKRKKKTTQILWPETSYQHNTKNRDDNNQIWELGKRIKQDNKWDQKKKSWINYVNRQHLISSKFLESYAMRSNVDVLCFLCCLLPVAWAVSLCIHGCVLCMIPYFPLSIEMLQCTLPSRQKLPVFWSIFPYFHNCDDRSINMTHCR